MLRAIFRRLLFIAGLSKAPALVFIWIHRGIVYVFRWFLYVYSAHIHPLRLSGRILPSVLVASLAYLIGNQILSEEPSKVIVMVAALLFVGLVVSRVYIALCLYLMLLSTIFFPSAIPKPITFGGAGLGLTEILLMVILFTAYFKAYGERRHVSSPMTPPYLLLLFSVLLALAVSYREYLSNPRGFYDFTSAYNAGRELSPYGFFFGILYGVRGKKELRLVFNIVLGLAVFVAVVSIAQYIVGPSHQLTFGSPDDQFQQISRDMSDETPGVSRVQTPGGSLVCLFLLTTIYLTAASKGRKAYWYGFLAMLLLGSQAISFGRNAYIATVFGLVGMFLLSPKAMRLRLFVVSLTGIFLFLAFLQVAATISPRGESLRTALADRVMKIITVEKTYNESSLMNRRQENRIALKLALEHPVFGVGIGAPIRHRFAHFGRQLYPVSQNVIHNSYLDTWLHYGICGLIAIAWLSWIFLWRAFRLWKHADEPWIRYMAMTFALNYILWLFRSFVIMSIVHSGPELVLAAFQWGMVEVASNLAIAKTASQERADIVAAGMLPLGTGGGISAAGYSGVVESAVQRTTSLISVRQNHSA